MQSITDLKKKERREVGRRLRESIDGKGKIKLLKTFNSGLLCIALSYMLSCIDRGRGRFCDAAYIIWNVLPRMHVCVPVTSVGSDSL